MRPHLASAFIGRTSLQQPQHFFRDTHKGSDGHAEISQGLEFGQLMLQILHPRSRRCGFELVKEGLRGIRLDQEKGIKACEDLWGQMGGDLRIEILKEAVEGTSDKALEFTFGWQFNPSFPESGRGRLQQVRFGRRCGRGGGLEPSCQLLLILRSGKAPMQVLPNEAKMGIMAATVPRIGGRVVP
jgi:hypothetical protein